MQTITDQEFWANLIEQGRLRRELESRMLINERIIDFLTRCRSRGARYSPGRTRLPNHSQLAMYCGCDVSTIGRIQKGRTKNPPLSTIAILSVLACIYPSVPKEDLLEEQRARIADADRWLQTDERTRSELREALVDGIMKRRFDVEQN
ncbi:hypothetical protein [Novipirellula sp.]|uniref:hypothetical protein n=1 Tax=Novipirellula sp. TaxID=2795430 RepID=UPI003564F2EA